MSYAVAIAGQKDFEFPWPAIDGQDLGLYVTVGGATATLEPGSDFTTSGTRQSGGGEVTLIAGRSVGDVVTICRATATERVVDFSAGGTFRPANVELELNNLEMQLQDLQRSQRQCLAFPPYKVKQPWEATIVTDPVPGKLLCWGDQGAQVTNCNPGEGVTLTTVDGGTPAAPGTPIRFYRGTNAQRLALPTGLPSGMPFWTVDRHRLYIGDAVGPWPTKGVAVTGNPVFDVGDYGAVCDDSTDDTEAIAAALGAAANASGGEVSFCSAAGRTCVIAPWAPAEPIFRIGADNITVNGCGATLRVENPANYQPANWNEERELYAVFFAARRDHFTLRDLLYDGNRDGTNAPLYQLWSLVQCDNATIEGNSVWDSGNRHGAGTVEGADRMGDQLGGAPTCAAVKHLRIRDNHIKGGIMAFRVVAPLVDALVENNSAELLDICGLEPGIGYAVHRTVPYDGTLECRGIRIDSYYADCPLEVGGPTRSARFLHNFVQGMWGLEYWNQMPGYGRAFSADSLNGVVVGENTFETFWGISTNSINGPTIVGNTVKTPRMRTVADLQAYEAAGGRFQASAKGSFGGGAQPVAVTEGSAAIVLNVGADHPFSAGDYIGIAGLTGTGGGIAATDLNGQMLRVESVGADTVTVTLVDGELAGTVRATRGSPAITNGSGTTLQDDLADGDQVVFRFDDTTYGGPYVVSGEPASQTTMTLGSDYNGVTAYATGITKVLAASATASWGGDAGVWYLPPQSMNKVCIEARPGGEQTVTGNTCDGDYRFGDSSWGIGIACGMPGMVDSANDDRASCSLVGNRVYRWDTCIQLGGQDDSLVEANELLGCKAVIDHVAAQRSAGDMTTKNTAIAYARNVYRGNEIQQVAGAADQYHAVLVRAEIDSVAQRVAFDDNTIYFPSDGVGYGYPLYISDHQATVDLRRNHFYGFYRQAVRTAGAVTRVVGNDYWSLQAAPDAQTAAVRVDEQDNQVFVADKETVAGAYAYLQFADADPDAVGGSYMLGDVSGDLALASITSAANDGSSVEPLDFFWPNALGFAATRSMTADDTTPSVAGGVRELVSVANSGATAITQLDGARVGQVVTIRVGSGTNPPTISDGGNFVLSANWTPGYRDTLTVETPDGATWLELSRSDN